MDCRICSPAAPQAQWQKPLPRTQQAQPTLLSVHATSHLGGALQVRTDEGDTVTISLSQDRDATYTRLAGRSGRDGQSASAERSSSHVSVQNSLTIDVQGSLNEQEQADIDALVSTFRRAAALFGRGDESGSSALLASVDGLDSLAGFSADFDRSRTYEVVRAANGDVSAPVHGKPDSAPAIDTKPLVVPADPAGTPGAGGAAGPGGVAGIGGTSVTPGAVDSDGDSDGETTATQKPAHESVDSHAELLQRLEAGRRQFAQWLREGAGGASSSYTSIASAVTNASKNVTTPASVASAR